MVLSSSRPTYCTGRGVGCGEAGRAAGIAAPHGCFAPRTLGREVVAGKRGAVPRAQDALQNGAVAGGGNVLVARRGGGGSGGRRPPAIPPRGRGASGRERAAVPARPFPPAAARAPGVGGHGAATTSRVRRAVSTKKAVAEVGKPAFLARRLASRLFVRAPPSPRSGPVPESRGDLAQGPQASDIAAGMRRRLLTPRAPFCRGSPGRQPLCRRETVEFRRIRRAAGRWVQRMTRTWCRRARTTGSTTRSFSRTRIRTMGTRSR